MAQISAQISWGIRRHGDRFDRLTPEDARLQESFTASTVPNLEVLSKRRFQWHWCKISCKCWCKLDHQIIIRASFESVGICSHSCRNSLEFIRQTSSNIIEVLAERPWQHSVASRAFEPPWRATCWIGFQQSQNPNVSAAFQSAATAASVKMAFKIAELIRDKGKKCKKAQSKKKNDINWHQLTSIDDMTTRLCAGLNSEPATDASWSNGRPNGAPHWHMALGLLKSVEICGIQHFFQKFTVAIETLLQLRLLFCKQMLLGLSWTYYIFHTISDVYIKSIWNIRSLDRN